MSSLAAARADNFYYPPEWTPDQGSINKFQGQHPLRARAKKINEGIIVIRFEMPFNVWCGNCHEMIAKGVRFNAEKKHIGNYLSTKIWSFKMKSACCQNEIEIQTDPKNCDYIVVKGGEKKSVEYDAEDAQTLLLNDAEEKEKLADPLYRLEHGNQDKQKAKEAYPILTSLKKISDARHSDPYKQNRLLRSRLREQKSRVAEEEKQARELGLSMRLLPQSEDDARVAAAVAFRPKFDVNLRTKRALIQASSIFSQASTSTSPVARTSRDTRKRGADHAGRSAAGGGSRPLSLVEKRHRVDFPAVRTLLAGNYARPGLRDHALPSLARGNHKPAAKVCVIRSKSS